MKCKSVPVITGVIGTVTEGLRRNLEATPGKLSIDSGEVPGRKSL